MAVIAYNDAFVMSAWSKANGVKNDDIVSSICSSHFYSLCRVAMLDSGKLEDMKRKYDIRDVE